MAGRQAAIIIGGERACPLLATGMGVGGCLKEGCAWWSKRGGSCGVLLGIEVACNLVEHVVAMGARVNGCEQKGT